jgi:hypothetical protein
MDPWESPTLAIMRHYGAPLTREVYIALNWGDSAYEPTAEEEVEMPVEFQSCDRCWYYPCRCTIPGVAGFDCECEPCTARRNE